MVWVGTLDALHVLQRGAFDFVRYRHDHGDPRSLSRDGVFALAEDGGGRIGVGTFYPDPRLVQEDRGRPRLREAAVARAGVGRAASAIAVGQTVD